MAAALVVEESVLVVGRCQVDTKVAASIVEVSIFLLAVGLVVAKRATVIVKRAVLDAAPGHDHQASYLGVVW